MYASQSWAYLKGGRVAGAAPPQSPPKNCRSTTTKDRKDRLAALLLLQCQAYYWIRKPDDSTSFSSVNELKKIVEVVLLIDISAAFLSCVLCVHIATGLAKQQPPILHTQLCQLTGLFSNIYFNVAFFTKFAIK